MSKLRYILLILLLCPMMGWAQRRLSADQQEIDLHRQSGFSSREVENKTDALFGLHASLYSGTHHLIGLSADGGWSSFINNMPAAKNTPGGGSIGLHFLYEYQFSGLIIQTGIGIAYQRVFTDLLDTTMYHYNMDDAWSGISTRKFDLRHTFFDRRDQAQQLYGRIPLYVGHYIFGGQGIAYFLAGFHAQYAFWGNTKQRLTGSTAGKYHDFVGVWDEMDNHGFRKNVPIERKGDQLKLKFDLMAHAEVGYEYNTQQAAKDYRVRPSDRIDCRLRFAGYIDFGILNICPETKKELYGVPEATIYDFPTYRMDHVFSTSDAARYWMRNLSVGIRFTVLFGFRPAERCILCDPWKH